MTAITFSTAPRVLESAQFQNLISKLLNSLSGAIDDFAAHQMQQAVPESVLRRANREI
jgi:hypothetical protein